MTGAATGRALIRLAMAVGLAAGANVRAAEDDWALRANDARWLFQTSVYTRHYHYDPRHNNHQRLLNLERWNSAGNGLGVALFDNSFGQPSQYVYGGKFWRPFDGSAPLLHMKLTAGLISGYKGEYQDKIPYNRNGIAPAIIPSIGLSGRRYTGEVVLLWNAGAMVTFGVYLN